MSLISSLLFLALIAGAKNAPECEHMDVPRVLGRLSYSSLKPHPRKKDGTCSVKIIYNDDGITKWWMFDQKGKITFAIELKRDTPPAMLAQNFVFPGNQNPQIKNLKTNPPTLKITTANGSELFFDINRGEFLPNSVPNIKYLSNAEIDEDIKQMTKELGKIPDKKERRRYVDSHPNRDLASVESFSGEYLKYNAKFGDTPDSVRGFGLEIIQNLPNNGKKSCTLLADEFMKKDDTPELRRFTQYYTPELIAAVKSAKCEKQSSWTKGVYPPASDSKPLHAK